MELKRGRTYILRIGAWYLGRSVYLGLHQGMHNFATQDHQSVLVDPSHKDWSAVVP